MTLKPLAAVLATHGLQPKKSLGQHFLLDANLLATIVADAGDLAGLHVIEIGPGPGGLTRALLASGAASVTVIEKDTRFLPVLEELRAYYGERLRIVAADALQCDPRTLTPEPRAILANLPYNIGTLLVAGWLEHLARSGARTYRHITVMLQEEVAMRLIAEPGSKAYGRVSVLARWLTEPALLRRIPPGAFTPPPNVMSAMIQLRPRPAPLADATLASLTRVLAAAFNQRRKMLRRSLMSLGVDTETLLRRAAIDATRRPETLSVEEFCSLARSYDALCPAQSAVTNPSR